MGSDRVAVASLVSSTCNFNTLRTINRGMPTATLGGMATTKTLAAVLTLSFLAGCDQQGETVGPRGGVVMSDDGRVTLDIPAGALTDEVEVSIEVVEDAPGGIVGVAYAIEPAGVSLLRPATLTYDLAADADDTDRSLELGGLEMSDLVLVTEKADRWQPMSDRDVDADAQLLTASVLYFSSYAIVSR